MKNASRRLNLSVQYACNREGLPLRADFVRWARAALVGGGEITIRLVDAEEGQALNNEYRGKDYATNVLSFPYDTEPVVLATWSSARASWRAKRPSRTSRWMRTTRT